LFVDRNNPIEATEPNSRVGVENLPYVCGSLLSKFSVVRYLTSGRTSASYAVNEVNENIEGDFREYRFHLVIHLVTQIKLKVRVIE
jgi:hypothetical protein